MQGKTAMPCSSCSLLPAPKSLTLLNSTSQCGVQERELFLGSFATENTAAKAHDVAALRLQADHASAHQVQVPWTEWVPVLQHDDCRAHMMV